MSGQNGSGLGGPVVVVARVFPVGYLPPPGKGKGKISEISVTDLVSLLSSRAST